MRRNVQLHEEVPNQLVTRLSGTVVMHIMDL